MPIASDELKTSMRSMPGWWRSIASFTGSLHITPELVTSTNDERSQRSGSASSAATIGLANVSPTIVSAPTFRRSMVSSISSMFSFRSSRVTTEPPCTR